MLTNPLKYIFFLFQLESTSDLRLFTENFDNMGGVFYSHLVVGYYTNDNTLTCLATAPSNKCNETVDGGFQLDVSSIWSLKDGTTNLTDISSRWLGMRVCPLEFL